MAEVFNGIILDGSQVTDEELRIPNLKVTGKAQFLNDVDVNIIEVEGEAVFNTFMTCDRLNVSGSCICRKNILAETVKCFGISEFQGGVRALNILAGGRMLLCDDTKTGNIVVKQGASVRCSGKLSSDRAVIYGLLNMTGSMRCRSISVMSEEKSYVNEIITDTLQVSSRHMNNNDYELVCDFADCIHADIDNSCISQLYCDTAVIRGRCSIHEIIYKNSIEIEEGAVVERLARA